MLLAAAGGTVSEKPSLLFCGLSRKKPDLLIIPFAQCKGGLDQMQVGEC